MNRPAILTLAASLVASPSPGTSQAGPVPAGISGQLLDRASRLPLADASITIVGTRVLLRSDTAGRFLQAGVPPGQHVLEARALGYAPGVWIIELSPAETLTVVIELEAVGIALAGITVEGRPREQRGIEGFERRRQRGQGIYLTEGDIAKVKGDRLVDLLRSSPGVRLICRNSGCRIRMSRANCQPDFFVDGLPANNSTSLEMPTIGLIAMEIYRTSTETPLEFLRGNNTCGTIVIWTRSGL
jgi:hypothetical protein